MIKTILTSCTEASIKEIVSKIGEKYPNAYWFLSGVDLKFRNTIEYSGIGMEMEQSEDFIWRMKIINNEILELNNDELLCLLENVYDFEFGILICFECKLDFEHRPQENIYPQEAIKFPFSEYSVLEVNIFEEAVTLYIPKERENLFSDVVTQE